MKGSLKNWEDSLMEDLRNPEAAQAYIQGCLEEGVPLQTALRDVIKAQGFGEVAKKAQIARPNLLRAVRPSSNPTFETMERLLHGVGLDFSVRPWKTKRKAKPRVQATA
jgi:probable addiction module antidote protein